VEILANGAVSDKGKTFTTEGTEFHEGKPQRRPPKKIKAKIHINLCGVPL
jgi:hypothetical protein